MSRAACSLHVWLVVCACVVRCFAVLKIAQVVSGTDGDEQAAVRIASFHARVGQHTGISGHIRESMAPVRSDIFSAYHSRALQNRDMSQA